MIGLLKRWFGKPSPTASPSVPNADATVGAGIQSEESAEMLYQEFCRTFCFRPGVNLMDHLKAKGLTELIAWFHPSTPEPEPKSFIALAVNGARDGHKIWEKQGVSIFHEGRWDQGGGPTARSQEALAVLAQVLGKPIKVYFRENPESEMRLIRESRVAKG
jgi:hypothetical protein